LSNLRRPRISTRSAAAIGLFALVAVLSVVAISGLTKPSSPGTVVARDPNLTVSATAWSLDELLHRADTGAVAAIGTMTPRPDPLSGERAAPILVARTRDGALEPIRLQVGLADAVDVVRAAGFGRLLTDEAIQAAASDGGTDQISTGLFLSVGLLLILVLAGRLRPGRGSGAWVPRRLRRTRGNRRRTELEGERPTVTLAHVAGVDEAKLELTETIEFLKDPARFARLGARAVRGVMLYGPPGTGKTLLARAVAAEAGVPFYTVSGSEFVEKFVGVGAGRVRDLFARARANGRGVIFIDEIDALAKARGGANSHEEREQTLNQLLVEMDGFDTTDEVVVIGATNRLDTLDEAVLRPGRFTRKIHVPLPDRDGRLAILAVHAAGKPVAAEVDLAAVARKTYGFSGAMLADLLNEAAIMAARSGAAAIGPEEIHAGWLKTALGTSRRRSMDERERSIIAAHEAGHAILGFLHGDKRRVEEISLFAHGEALGVTVSSSEDNDLPSERDLRARLVALMGGRVAEELLFSEVTGGAANDFEKATSIASAMVVRYGMGADPDADDGGVTGRGILSTLVGTRSEGINVDVRDAQARAIRRILDDAYAAARATLLAEMARLRMVSAYLYEQERIDGDAFEALMAGRLTALDADGWRAAAAAPRAWETIPALFSDAGRARGRSMAGAARATSSAKSPAGRSPARTGWSAPLSEGAPATAGRPRRGRRSRGLVRALPPIPARLRRSVAAMYRALAEDEG
jgi:cell division protease FtsH